MTQKERISDFVRALLPQKVGDEQCAVLLGSTDKTTLNASNERCNNTISQSCGYNIYSCTNITAEICKGAVNNAICNTLEKPDLSNMLDRFCNPT